MKTIIAKVFSPITSDGKSFRRSLFVLGFLLFSLVIYQPSFALTNYIFFSVNGDTSATSMTQGDMVGWGANCAVGASMYWELWVDTDSDSNIDTLSDRLVVNFIVTDGDTQPDEGMPDISPTPDGWYVMPPVVMGAAPSGYIFRATDLSDQTRAQRTFISNPLVSPPNQFRGHVTIQGHPAPDHAFLSNLWIEANYEDGPFQIWSGLTNDSGYFEINVGAVGSGLNFNIRPPDLPGYSLNPSSIQSIASGVVENIDFAYSAPTDSIYGEIRDQNNTLLTFPINAYCRPRFGGQQREVTAVNGFYAIYFAPSDYGLWSTSLNSSDLVPNYLFPSEYEFDNQYVHSLRHDFTVYTADAVLYARITEFGGYPTHQYAVMAQSGQLNSNTMAISNTGPDNIVTLHISSLDPSGWFVTIGNWDDRYPIPPGYVLDNSHSWNNHPGDTVDLNFVGGNMVRDGLLNDPGDQSVDWSQFWVGLVRDGNSFGCNPDNMGIFTIYADTGHYWLNVNRTGYLTTPQSRFVHVTGDTTGGLGFLVNRAHCRVTGRLINVPLPLQNSVNIFAHTDTGNVGYMTWGPVDSLTGTYSFDLCDADWTIDPPYFDGVIPPPPYLFTVAEYPDTSRVVDLYYTPTKVDDPDNSMPGEFALSQNYPNPFNSSTIIWYSVPARSDIEIKVINILGQTVRVLASGDVAAGDYEVVWNGTNDEGNAVSSGIYFYQLRAGSYTTTRKMVLSK